MQSQTSHSTIKTSTLMQQLLPLCIKINSDTKHRVRYDFSPLMDGSLLLSIDFFQDGMVDYHKSSSWTIYPHWKNCDQKLKEVIEFLEGFVV